MIPLLQETMPSIKFSLDPLFQEHGIPLAIMGMLVVFLALALVVIFISLLPHVAQWISRGHAHATEAVLPVDDNELSEELLVVIAAAVAAIVQQPHRIVHIRSPEDLSWSFEARLQHHQSHRIPHRDRR